MLVIVNRRGKYSLVNGGQSVRCDGERLREWVWMHLTRPYPPQTTLTAEQARSLLDHLSAA